MIVSDVPCAAAAVYTTNKVKGAPIIVTKKNLKKTGGVARAGIVNSKKTQTPATQTAKKKSRKMCSLAANALGIKKRRNYCCLHGRYRAGFAD
ncbi:MAG: bifunctional ornithine acetyltransferase/N-acetylglutamate synthase [Anaerotruncus sp.]|nr:MAG: bifunctional ornithine acetyltransferase/N-acetylglutamate synthase [Anaerotruncus sp.]